MNSVIYNPLEEFEAKFKTLHLDKTNAYFEKYVQESKVNIEENRETVKKYNQYTESVKKMKKTLTWLKVLRVLMCITILLIPVVIWKTTPKIKALKAEIEEADKKAAELLDLAYSQMAPLNNSFTDRDALNLIEQVIPLIKFEDTFSAEQELDMKINYDFAENNEDEQSTIDVLSGRYNSNPFLFENKVIHTMGMETYHGYKTIYWTETYRDSNGKLRTRTRSETLHATVTKPKPFYSTQVVLNYGSQGGQELSFSRDATHLEQKSEREIERYVKKGEKRLKKKTDEAISQGKDFMSMSNSDFEVLFDALDRTNEVQFRTLFTPLAQTNMVDLLLSKSGYGDDFNFYKTNRMNKIVSNHSQGRVINLTSNYYTSYSFDIIKDNFINKNTDFFKAVYFDFAPLLAIPMYQERPVQSLKPIPDYRALYSYKECEVLANLVDKSMVVHPQTKTNAIIKSSYVSTKDKVDERLVSAYSYDTIGRVDIVRMHGGDGRWHDVSVPWDEYIPLEHNTTLFVSEAGTVNNRNIMAVNNGLCIFN